MAKTKRKVAKRRATRSTQDKYIVIYKVSVFTALVIVIGAFLMALFMPFVSNTVSILGIFTSR